MSRAICKSILLPSLTSTHLRAAPLRSAASRSSRMAAEDSSSSSSSSSSPSPSSAIDFLTLCHRLKCCEGYLSLDTGVGFLAAATKRAGWVRRGVKEPESIADHMYRMGLMALIASDIPGVNREKCMKIAIVHDIAEAIVGDITPSDGIPKEEKSRREQEALKNMCELLGGGERAEEIRDLWMEYEDNSSMEAKLVKDFDKVEMILQALEYENDLDRKFAIPVINS
ncbi:metal-dependent phosphohydrolase HD domain-containing protein [Striga asiatica]|uniref:5'-deoxynucleotidase n=1 Tax=Striga asiatica TaxID=4170 RepID=A0A5A7R5F7_STRAF|nr:metal-dependent phosphohydrolase HD domain-containing protein [Striga asiatica]